MFLYSHLFNIVLNQFLVNVAEWYWYGAQSEEGATENLGWWERLCPQVKDKQTSTASRVMELAQHVPPGADRAAAAASKSDWWGKNFYFMNEGKPEVTATCALWSSY